MVADGTKIADKEITLDYLVGPNVITNILKWGRGKQKNQDQTDDIMRKARLILIGFEYRRGP